MKYKLLVHLKLQNDKIKIPKQKLPKYASEY